MGFLDKVEKSIEGAVSGVFARAFRGEVEPVEIAGGCSASSTPRRKSCPATSHWSRTISSSACPAVITSV